MIEWLILILAIVALAVAYMLISGGQVAPFVADIERLTVENPYHRHVVYTSPKMQLALMNIPPGKNLGVETHKSNDQFFRVERGRGYVNIAGDKRPITDGSAIIIPAGIPHDIVNDGLEPLKLYTIYSPSHHPEGTLDVTIEDEHKREKRKL